MRQRSGDAPMQEQLPLKTAPIPLLALVGTVLAGGAIYFANFGNPPPSPNASPPAVTTPQAPAIAPPAAPLNAPPLAPSSPPPVTSNAVNNATIAGVSHLGASNLFRSLRLTPRRPALQLEPPRPAAPPAETEVTLLSSERLARRTRASPPTPPSQSAPPATTLPEIAATEPAKPAAAPETIFAFGAGVDHMPRWQGSAKSENRPIPYIDINWRDQIEFSTVKGLIIDLLHGEQWHGGFIGTLVWGRSTKDLAGLKAPTLRNTLQGGIYLEYALTPQTTLGVRLRQDLQNTGGSYSEIYGELELPKLGYLEHDLRFSIEGMNQTGMRRFFGLSAQDAARLGVSAYQPDAATSKTSLTYEGFQPTSESTGIAFGATIGRLSSMAANSPLVRNFGSKKQKEVVVAFVYHF